MPDTSPSLALPYLQPAQAQKHVTHNEALRRLDLLVQLVVVQFGAEVPPAAPAPGEAWALGAAPQGDWTGQAGQLAVWEGPGWGFVTPREGWRAWGRAEGELRVWRAGAWGLPAAAAPPALDGLEGLGIGTAHDAANRLAVAAAATLFTHDGAGHQLKINKAAAADTASLLFQQGWSGRAEIGLMGDAALALKVSADGTAWTEALRADPATGRLQLPQGGQLAPGSAGAPALGFLGDADTGLFRPAENQIGFAAGGVQRALLSGTGLQLDGLLTGPAVATSSYDTTAGRLWANASSAGMFGWGSLTSGSSLLELDDTALATGLYRVTTAYAGVGQLPGALAGQGCILRVERYSSAALAQTVYRQSGTLAGGIWRRFYISNAWQPWVQIAAASVLGAVAQSGGVPTGALFEAGSNANGSYLRLADGTMICRQVLAASAGAGTSWVFPAAFAAAPVVTGSAVASALVSVVLDSAPGATAVVFSARDKTDARGAFPCHLVARGRWF